MQDAEADDAGGQRRLLPHPPRRDRLACTRRGPADILVVTSRGLAMELSSGVLSRSEYLRAVGRVVELLAAAEIAEVLVAYGFGCDCPDDMLYQDVIIPRVGA